MTDPAEVIRWALEVEPGANPEAMDALDVLTAKADLADRYREALEATQQDAEWAKECLTADGFEGGRSTSGGDRALTYIERIADRAALAAADREPAEWRCKKCGSSAWVAASLNGGRTRIRQCVPCGHYSADPVPAPVVSSEPAETPEENVTEGLPPDLVTLLRDPDLRLPQDDYLLADGSSLWDRLQEWRNAPSNTASAWPEGGLPHGEHPYDYGYGPAPSESGEKP